MSDEILDRSGGAAGSRPAIVGDVVFGDMASPVAVCTLASRTMLAKLAGRPEIAVAGRVFTENVGIEKMVQNLAAFESVRFLIVCGRETRHKVGQTILALHKSGLDAQARVVGSDAPEPIMPNLTEHQLRAFQARITVVDMMDVTDAEAVVERARALSESPASDPPASSDPADSPAGRGTVERIVAARDPIETWIYDSVGYFLVFVDRTNRLLRVEQYTSDHRQVRIIEGANAEEICHTIVRLAQVTLLAHAAYLGRELAKAETALRLGLPYEQDRPLASPAQGAANPPAGTEGGA
jgi:tetrahydromethanopterin S-methyltransferase subunit A